jgi:hypothetical protein
MWEAMPVPTKLPELPTPSAVLFLVGAALIVWLALMPMKRREHACRLMDRALGVYGPVANVIVLRERREEMAVRESFKLARNWWQHFRPLIMARASEFAED